MIINSVADLPAGSITFHNPEGKPILIILPDGRLQRGEAFATNDEASVAFFDCISAALPSFISDLRHRCEIADAYLARARGQATTH